MRRTHFRVIGTGWFPNTIEFFELDFHYQNRRDLTPTRILFKLGQCDRRGNLIIRSAHLGPDHRFLYRPKSLKDWFIAVEITPEESTDNHS